MVSADGQTIGQWWQKVARVSISDDAKRHKLSHQMLLGTNYGISHVDGFGTQLGLTMEEGDDAWKHLDKNWIVIGYTRIVGNDYKHYDAEGHEIP